MPTCYRHPGRETHIRCQRCDRPICPDCMVDAAVGFQCPTCVAEGRRQVRADRTAYGGIRPTNPGVTTGVLIGLNAAVWAAIMVTGYRASELIDRLALVPVGRCGSEEQPGAGYRLFTESTCERFTNPPGDGVWFPGVAEGSYWQLVTSMFSHVEIWHIGFNMLALWVLGPQLELVMGRLRFLGLYLLSGLTGSVFVYWLSGEYSATLGASGAVFGLMGALVVVALKVGGNVQSLLTWVAINAVITVVGASYISWQGHLGGFIGGVALAGAVVLAPRQRRGAVQLAAFAGFAAVLVAAIVVRSLALT